jgi:hypothetical protein
MAPTGCEVLQRLLILGRVFAQGAQRRLLRLRIEAMTEVGGADALPALRRHRTIAQFLVPPIRGQMLLSHCVFLNECHGKPPVDIG